MSVNTNDLLIFLHVPKTAGSTFHQILNARYRASKTHNVFGSRYSEESIAEFMRDGSTKYTGVELLKGHMPFGLHSYASHSKSRYITILRNPIERVISQYYYIKKNVNNPLYDAVEGGGMSITDFVESGVAVGMNNGQCRFLNGDLDEYAFNECDEQLLNQVKDNIEKHFVWVGLTERFDESVLLLADLMKWKKLPFYFRENVSKTRKPARAISDQDIKAIQHYNKYDLELYEYAGKRLDAQIANSPEFSRRLSAFVLKNQRLQKRWGRVPHWLREPFL